MDWVSPHGFCLANFDPTLIMLSDAGNILTSLAYIVGFPFAMFRLFECLPKRMVPVLAIGILFVVACGVGHLIDSVTTHQASYLAYLIAGWESLATGLVSWGFVLAMFWATQHAGLRLVADSD